MKTKLLLLFSLFSICIANAQLPTVVNFESGNNSLIKIDTSRPNNIWQIGRPHKIFFDSAYSKPNAIVTDTINPYPIKNISSFQFVMKSPSFPKWGYGCVPYFQFIHKYDTDSLFDGGYIEASEDNGITWNNISNLTFYSPDTIIGGIHAFTGNSGGWQFLNYYYNWCNYSSAPDSLIIRFTFKSDSVNTNKEGWMIDNLEFGTMVCEGVNDIKNIDLISLYPNPATDNLIIDISTTLNIPATIEISNIEGQVIERQTTNVETTNIVVSAFAKGMYFVKIKTEKGVESRKFVKL